MNSAHSIKKVCMKFINSDCCLYITIPSLSGPNSNVQNINYLIAYSNIKRMKQGNGWLLKSGSLPGNSPRHKASLGDITYLGKNVHGTEKANDQWKGLVVLPHSCHQLHKYITERWLRREVVDYLPKDTYTRATTVIIAVKHQEH